MPKHHHVYFQMSAQIYTKESKPCQLSLMSSPKSCAAVEVKIKSRNGNFSFLMFHVLQALSLA